MINYEFGMPTTTSGGKDSHQQDDNFATLDAGFYAITIDKATTGYYLDWRNHWLLCGFALNTTLAQPASTLGVVFGLGFAVSGFISLILALKKPTEKHK